jgi:hypothetical protein
LNRQFSEEEIQMAYKYMKCSRSLAVKKMKIKTTLTFHLTPVIRAIIKKTNKKCWWGCNRKESSYTLDENTK